MRYEAGILEGYQSLLTTRPTTPALAPMLLADFAEWHMTLIFTGAVGTAVAASRFLLAAGVESLMSATR
jgi:hypothetical protein